VVDHSNSALDEAFALAVLAFIALTATVSISAYLRRPRQAGGEGSIILGPAIRGWYLDNLRPFEELCVQHGISPTVLSYLQLGGSLVVGYCYAVGLLFTGGWLLMFTGTLDMIDGRIARRTNTGSARGAFLDSVVDRYADSLAYLGLAVFFRDAWVLWPVLFAFLGTLMVSYARARGEGLGVQCKVGMLQRPERYVILGFGSVFGVLFEHIAGPVAGHSFALIIVTIVALAVLVNFTAWQRVVYIWRALGEPPHA